MQKSPLTHFLSFNGNRCHQIFATTAILHPCGRILNQSFLLHCFSTIILKTLRMNSLFNGKPFLLCFWAILFLVSFSSWSYDIGLIKLRVSLLGGHSTPKLSASLKASCRVPVKPKQPWTNIFYTTCRGPPDSKCCCENMKAKLLGSVQTWW